MNIRATERHFSFLASCVTGYDVRVTITNDSSYVGYTSMPQQGRAHIVLSCTTNLYHGLPEKVTLMMMLGVLAHECMHLKYTNFDACNRMAIVLPKKADKEAFLDINNIIEDIAIEFAAYQSIGGKMLKALAAVIKHTWMTSPNLEEGIPAGQEEAYAYTQVIRALIQVGDRGMTKGKFLTQTAQNAFLQVLPLFNAAAVEPDGETRVDYAIEVYKILAPLIRKEAEETQKSLPKNGKPNMPSGMGEGNPIPGDNDECDDDKGAGNSAHSANSAEQKKKMREQLANQMQEATAAAANGDDTTAANATSNEHQQSEQNTKQKTHSVTPKPSEIHTERPYEASTKDANDLTGMDEDMEFSDEDYNALVEDINQVETQIRVSEAAEAALAQKAQDDLMMDCEDIINQKANNPDEERYNRIIQAYSPKIATLTSELRKIFMNDRSRVKNSNHGSRVNTRRLVDGKLHSNIMLQRTFPKELDDMAVYLLIDKSGSMGRSNGKGKRNDQCAAETAICLYEALHALRIPVYITGFTTRGPKALHMHYVTWNSPTCDKYTLANFACDDCNYDFYSITEATRILMKHHARHKLLIVISDGAPCNPRGGMNSMDGVNATAAAIENARKTTDVLGVALNCFDEKVYADMYGKDYITVSTAHDMFIPISETLQKIVKSW